MYGIGEKVFLSTPDIKTLEKKFHVNEMVK